MCVEDDAADQHCEHLARFLPPPHVPHTMQMFGVAWYLRSQVIKGWTEAMQMMKEGDTFQLFIPPGDP